MINIQPIKKEMKNGIQLPIFRNRTASGSKIEPIRGDPRATGT